MGKKINAVVTITCNLIFIFCVVVGMKNIPIEVLCKQIKERQVDLSKRYIWEDISGRPVYLNFETYRSHIYGVLLKHPSPEEESKTSNFSKKDGGDPPAAKTGVLNVKYKDKMWRLVKIGFTQCDTARTQYVTPDKKKSVKGAQNNPVTGDTTPKNSKPVNDKDAATPTKVVSSNRMEAVEDEIERKVLGSRAKTILVLAIDPLSLKTLRSEEDNVRKAFGIPVPKDKAKDLGLPIKTEWVFTTQEFIDNALRGIHDTRGANTGVLLNNPFKFYKSDKEEEEKREGDVEDLTKFFKDYLDLLGKQAPNKKTKKTK